MEDEIEIDHALEFFKAASEGLKKGQARNFKCPLCNGQAIALKSSRNGHIHARCNDCGYTMLQ